MSNFTESELIPIALKIILDKSNGIATKDLIIELRNLILTIDDLKLHDTRIKELEREITLFHSKIVSEISLKYKDEIDFIGFHGQTIYHNPDQKISKQLGDGKLMSQLVKKKLFMILDKKTY